MEPVVLKKSCDACTASKVKCSGGFPCERCVLKGINCFYSPRKRRAKPSKVKKAKNEIVTTDTGLLEAAASFDPSVPMESLVEWERRSWSVFFTLYKHYGTGCSLRWFNKQLNKMRKYLSRQGNKESLKRLTAWMNALNIDVAALAEQVDQCTFNCKQTVAQLQLRVDGTVSDPKEKRLSAKLTATNERTPFLKLVLEHPMVVDSDDVTVTCNSAFTSVFGVTQEALQAQLDWTAGGFLPWGGDLLARLLTKEKDLLAFVQILAIKFNTLEKPKVCPIVRDIPSCHMFEVNIREHASGNSFTPVNSLIKCMHREIVSEKNVTMEISMEFIPLVPYDHLFEGTGPIADHNLSASSCSTSISTHEDASVLKMKHQVEPFCIKHQAKRRKKEIDNSYEEFSSCGEYDGRKAEEIMPIGIEDRTSANTLSIFNSRSSSYNGVDGMNSSSSCSSTEVVEGSNRYHLTPSRDPASSGEAIERTMEQELKFIKTDRSGDMIQQGLEDYDAGHPADNLSALTANNFEETSVVFEDQADWLDNLLDWAKS